MGGFYHCALCANELSDDADAILLANQNKREKTTRKIRSVESEE
ncbi:hypothetical protein [Treponema sp. R8-4-B8]